MSARLSKLLLLTRDVANSARFFGAEGLGLAVLAQNDGYAELALGSGPVLALQQVEREADCSTGYSPLVQLEVDDMDSTITRAITLGARLDGPIKYPVYGKVASLRSPDGHMVGLFEPNEDLLS